MPAQISGLDIDFHGDCGDIFVSREVAVSLFAHSTYFSDRLIPDFIRSKLEIYA